MEQDERFMREALREAQAAQEAGEIPIGAVVVWKGRVIGRGHNQTERLHDTTAHAEMIAITAATEAMGGKYLTDCTLYVTVEPCPMCAGALAWSQIGRIVYGAPDQRRGAAIPSSLLPCCIPARKPSAASFRRNVPPSCWSSSAPNARPASGRREPCRPLLYLSDK